MSPEPDLSPLSELGLPVLPEPESPPLSGAGLPLPGAGLPPLPGADLPPLSGAGLPLRGADWPLSGDGPPLSGAGLRSGRESFPLSVSWRSEPGSLAGSGAFLSVEEPLEFWLLGSFEFLGPPWLRRLGSSRAPLSSVSMCSPS